MDRRGYFMLLNSKKYNYVSFRNLEDNDITLTIKKNNANAPTVKFYYSDSEYSKGTYAESTTTGVNITIPAGGCAYIRGVGNEAWATMRNDASVLGYNTIGCNGRYSVSGTATVLLDSSNLSSGLMDADAAFACMFNADGEPNNATNLIDASELVLPSVMRNNCFRAMFKGCAALTAMPAIPETRVDVYCFYQMFQDCSSLTSAPNLILDFGINSSYACYNMFRGCTSLVSVGADSIFRSVWTSTPTSQGVMWGMFRSCTSLLHGVDMNMSAVYHTWCLMMYMDCTSLQEVPRLSSRTDNTLYGYRASFARMFKNCTSLTSIGSHYNLYGSGFGEMFMGCTGITSLPQGMRMYGETRKTGFTADGSNIFIGAKEGIFKGCTNLIDASGVQIEVIADDITNDCDSAYKEMFKDCSSLTGAPDLSRVISFSGNNSNNKATSIFYSAFHKCSSLVIPPALPPVSDLVGWCYYGMFSECGLTSTPSLAHITKVSTCSMEYMFNKCYSLTVGADMGSIIGANGNCDFAFRYMYRNCTGLLTVPVLPSYTMNGYHQMFEMFVGCTNMTGTARFAIGNTGNVAEHAFINIKISSIIATNENSFGNSAFYTADVNNNLKVVDITRLFVWDFSSGGGDSAEASAFHFTLDSLTIRGDYPPTSVNIAFINALAPNCTIKVHPNRVNEYKSATNWLTRADYISAITD